MIVCISGVFGVFGVFSDVPDEHAEIQKTAMKRKDILENIDIKLKARHQNRVMEYSEL